MTADPRIEYRQELIERDRLDMLHEIACKAAQADWDLVEKYKSLYVDLYGPLPGQTESQEGAAA